MCSSIQIYHFSSGNVLLTDLADMIPLMKRNLVKNLTALSAGFARVEVFEWGTDFNHLLPEGGEGYDLVLVADCIYYREVDFEQVVFFFFVLMRIVSLITYSLQSLTALVKTLEQVSMAGHRPTEILVCYEERESEEKRNLVKDFTRLIETNFTVSKIPLDDYHDDWKCDDVHILKLFRK